MGIYLPNMDMPKSCAGCPTCREGTTLDGDYWLMCGYNGKPLESEVGAGKPDWCPLVPVPEHGRLIDADAVYDAVERRYRVSSGEEHGAERDFLDLISDAPTVLEAEGKDDGT